jgi:hypothetical protein
MRRSFGTLRLCAIPGVSPRAGIRCPVGALRTPLLPRAYLRASDRSRGAPKNRNGAGSIRCMHWKRSNPSPRAQRENQSFPELTCMHRTGPAEPPKTAAERDRSDACIGSDQTFPLAHSAKTNPPPSLPACIGPVPRSPQKPQRSGIGPMHALEAIKPFPSRTARKPILPRAYLHASDRSRGASSFLSAGFTPRVPLIPFPA